ncbi:MAG: hypothetical protein ABH834_04005 [Candidatus Altiarchaeota archaeon]
MVVRQKSRGGVQKVFAVDLHVHTRASHGEANSADEVVTSAKEGGVKVVGVVDHDTVEGIRDVERARDSIYPELTVVPGVELSTDYRRKDDAKPLKIHVLGYNMNPRDTAFSATLRFVRGVQKGMGERSIQLLEHMAGECRKPVFISDELRYVVDRGQPNIREWVPKLLLADERNAGLVEEIVRREGVSGTEGELWEKLQRVLKRYTRRERIQTKQAVRLLAVARGEPVIAHVLDDENDLHILGERELMAVFRDLKRVGLAGLEAYHPSHTPEQVKFLEGAARALGLKVTGGSDFHGRAGEYVGMCGMDENPLGRRR